MSDLEGFQRRFLRGLAHELQPVVVIGKNGLTEALTAKAEAELKAHELIKIRFLDFKEEKHQILDQLGAALRADVVGVVGHIGLLFRQNREPKQRKIKLPSR